MIPYAYQQPLILLTLFIFLVLVYFVNKYKKSMDKKELIINEQKEKIKWLRQVFAENEHKFTQTEHDLEKKVLLLNSTIQSLEEQAKNGTKNQVVAKLEALQSKREKLLQRANINLD
ncbi:MAG: Unknown protein [uncultured Sulfurovum sp.]|uniref:Uncharacterized protein n=2 Tax=uncultured Sulfurovum sp. TaxID=269237 RepID=A0A6S6TV43_9BACT|nr:MAG: Unknown protein [uncultured Sulfurovum sp.]